MLRKLFSSIFQSMHAPSLPSPPEFPESPPEFPPSLPWPPEFLGPRDVDVVDTTSSLPTELLLEIFLRLEELADVIRCAGVCKPWRRAIIGNAASLRPRPDRFDPRLLLGVFHYSRYRARLRRTPGPFQFALPSNAVGRLGGYETARCLIPDAAGAGAGFVVDDRGLYRELLWSADGFILLMARTVNRLCLCNPMTGDCTFLPAAAASKCCAYVLLTGYDDASPPGTGNKLAVRILAVQKPKRHRFMFSKEDEQEQGLWYQVLGAAGGVWGAVQHSSDDSEVEAEQGGLCVWMERRSTQVCRETVYWLAGPSVRYMTCTLALDVRTGRTWTTELPHGGYHLNSRTLPDSSVPILATSGDGRLSLMESLRGPRIQVWVMLNGDRWWTLQQTIEIDVVSNLLPPQWPDDHITMLVKELMKDMSLTVFCPRSGCVVGMCLGRELLIDIHSGSPTCARLIGKRRGYECHPYEMDSWSTYISKMKQF